MRTPPAEYQVDERLVRSLLEDQHPELAARALTYFCDGWDNSLWRLGADLLVRLPRRGAAEPLAVNEQRWLGELAAVLPLPIPAPVRCGTPGRGYPWHWSVVPFLPGTPASRALPLRGMGAARALAAFLRALHVAAPSGAPHNPFRGVALDTRSTVFAERVAQLPDPLATRAVVMWTSAVRVAPVEGSPVWVRGDLHPANVLVERGELVGVVDFGDLTAGDPATDLAAAWLLFEAPLVDEVLGAYGATDPDLVERAKGWALFFGVLLGTLEDDEPHGLRAAGLACLDRLVGDAASS